MKSGLEGKRVLVSGGSRGIGRAIAGAFAAEGCRLALNARDADALQKTASALGPDVIALPGDVTDPAVASGVVEAAAGRLGGLDVLVTNVGSGRSVPPGQETPEEWQRVFAINLFSATTLVGAATPHLAKQGGSIVCISSICGNEAIPGAPVTYSAAKAALNAFVSGISRPLGASGIRINAIAPGNILFEGSVWERKLAEDRNAVESMLTREVALQSLGTPEDVARFAVILAAPDTGFASGAVFTVDGGQTRGT
ncbi:MAG: SDR family oxidoreductase [Rhizobiaceae bacterium]|nr:SDR family oxidoreductase [Rhizobiaceae bacterium]